jgi:hypothetical protein
MKSFELMNLNWVTFEEVLNYTKNITTMVYSFAWCDSKPNNTTWPFMLKETFYIGMSGGLNSDFTGDKKNPKKSKVRYTTAPHQRMKTHSRMFKNPYSNFGSEKRKYEIYHECFDVFSTYGKILCVALLTPKDHVKNNVKRNVISMIESEQIYEYSNLFNDPPLLNLAESDNVSDLLKIENSHSQQAIRKIKEQDLTRFMS